MAMTLPKADVVPRRVTILGSTGSVGCSTIDLIERDREGYVVEALTANRNVSSLADQSRRLKPRLAVIADPGGYRELKDELDGTGIEVAAGPQAVVEAAARPAEWVMAAISGAAGLEPTLAAIRRGAIIALANKECLVCAGQLLMAEVIDCGATVVPVDSEHNAVFQIFEFDRKDTVEKIILTASGGPFRTLDMAAMARVTPEQAVAHPNWEMGDKISVDSATMMNKGLELIEAYYLFPVSEDRIEVLIHPQSVVHSMVAYIDGSVLAQLGTPDMRTPIAYALGWPKRISAPAARLDLAAIGQLTFETPDTKRFPALQLAREALQSGGPAPTILSAANEIAVGRFLAKQIGFLDIARIVEQTLETVSHDPLHNLHDVRDMDARAREVAQGLVAQL